MPRMPFEQATSCRACHGALSLVLDLGAQPPANALLSSPTDAEIKIPLALARCQDCGLIQLTHTVAPELLFRNYLWVTGTAAGTQHYSKEFCQQTLARLTLCRRTVADKLKVLEIASNDGTFLARFKECGHRVLGVDPARNLASKACAQGIPTLAEFFDKTYAASLVQSEGEFDVVFARNVLPHVPDPQDVVQGMALCLNDTGVGAIEFHRADVILKELHYDSIYHEHVCYFSLHDLTRLVRNAGLCAFDVMPSPISGGSWVVYFSRRRQAPSVALQAALASEDKLGIAAAVTWAQFAQRCLQHKADLGAAIKSLRTQAAAIVGYGASARSATLLNFCGIGANDLSGIADANPLKQGLYAPGSHLKIAAPERLFAQLPDVVLLLAWNFRAEIVERLRNEFHFHGPVLAPLPGLPHWVEEP